MVNFKDPLLLIGVLIFIFGLFIFSDQDLNLSSPQNIIGLIFLIVGGGIVLFRYIQLKKGKKKTKKREQFIISRPCASIRGDVSPPCFQMGGTQYQMSPTPGLDTLQM